MKIQFFLLGALNIWIVLFSFILFGIWIYTIIEILNSKFSNESKKTLWLIVCIIFFIPGAIAYNLKKFLMGSNQAI